MKSISQVRHTLAVEGVTNILRVREVCQGGVSWLPRWFGEDQIGIKLAGSRQ